MALKLNVIIASTRPGRIGPSIAQWFYDYAKANSDFDVELVDLADFELPVYDEPYHPMMQKYQHEHTRRWAASVDSADAFVIVTPEYNYAPPPSLTNALTYVYKEWNYKPVAFVSYGGVSGGIRGVQTAKLTLTTLKTVPIMEQVTIPMVAEYAKDGVFNPNELHLESAKAVVAELDRWAQALKPLRQPVELAAQRAA